MERNEPPRWIQDKHFNEVLFCEDFLSAHPMVCVDGSFFTVEGRVADEEGIRKQIQSSVNIALCWWLPVECNCASPGMLNIVSKTV